MDFEAGELAALAGLAGTSAGTIDRGLAVARELLGMELAFVSDTRNDIQAYCA
jgi:hypothetical protein